MTDMLQEPDVLCWHDVCWAHDIPVDRGAALLVDGVAVAVFRLSSLTPGAADEWYAVSHIDPATNAPVMARGLVGSLGDDPVIPTVAAPLHKQRYDLRTGDCLDDPALEVTSYPVKVVTDRVFVSIG